MSARLPLLPYVIGAGLSVPVAGALGLSTPFAAGFAFGAIAMSIAAQWEARHLEEQT